jgi:hypothetical protein
MGPELEVEFAFQRQSKDTCVAVGLLQGTPRKYIRSPFKKSLYDDNSPPFEEWIHQYTHKETGWILHLPQLLKIYWMDHGGGGRVDVGNLWLFPALSTSTFAYVFLN